MCLWFCGRYHVLTLLGLHNRLGWLVSRVVSVLDSGAEGPGFKSLSGNSLMRAVHIRRACVHQAAKLLASLLRVARVTAGLAESNGSLPSGLWLTSPAGWLPRTGISSGTLHSVIEYGRGQCLDQYCWTWWILLFAGVGLPACTWHAKNGSGETWCTYWRSRGTARCWHQGDIFWDYLRLASVARLLERL